MTRPLLTALAAASAAILAGCAHCDTCDDFPAPCFDCGYASAGMSGPSGPMPMDGVVDGGVPMGASGQLGGMMPGPSVIMPSPADATGSAPVRSESSSPSRPVDLDDALDSRPGLDEPPPVPPLPDASSPTGSPFRG